MRFRYNPENLDDFPGSVEVIAVEYEDGDEIEAGEIRWYMPAWKHQMAGKTIREQRLRIEKLEALLKEAYGCIAAHYEARLHPVAYTVNLWRDKLASNGIEVKE